MVSLSRFLLVTLLGVQSVVGNVGQQMMRRQDEAYSSELQVESVGHVDIHEHRSLHVSGNGVLTRPATKAANVEPVNALGMQVVNKFSTKESEVDAGLDQAKMNTLNVCDRDFHVNEEDKSGSDICTIGKMSYDREDCMLAAEHLGYNLSDHFMLNTHYEDPLPYPKGCFVNETETPRKVSFNPSGGDYDPATATGLKICMRQLYVNGTECKDAVTACSDAGTGYVPVLEYDACWYAMKCHKTGDAPKLEQFRTNVTPSEYKKADKPQGCFTIASTGEWGFNWAHKEGLALHNPLPSSCDATPICYDSDANSQVPIGDPNGADVPVGSGLSS